jgi:hypothetical protein
MHVQLADDVTQRANVHLVGAGPSAIAQAPWFPAKALLIGDIQLKHLADRRARHQDEPGVIRIVGQQQAAKRKSPMTSVSC